MNNPLAKFMTANGRIKEDFLDQLAFNEKMAELGRLSAGVIHELNTPLSVIVSAAQMILREEDLPDFVKEMVERINLEAQRLSQYTRGVLSFARIEGEGAAEADVNQVLREVMAFLNYEAQKRSITVIEKMDYHLPSVVADGNRLKQIFINLIMNALQAMENGGTLTLRTLALDDRAVEVLITDTGPGIPSETIAHIFDPFYTTKEPGEGTGLGLFVTRNLVELLGGRIEVESAAGKGTTFTIIFPLS
ncbi:MAG: two-component system NtrC family sensor [Geobacteraceae bacterium]|nr:MAG: two-component system NtrC family sensor [Geobacteraceae bacterium]